jgi:hypothetical protein
MARQIRNFLRRQILFNTPTFFQGFASAFDIAGNYFRLRTSKSGIEADRKAMFDDWNAVGQDFWVSFEQFNRHLN